MVRVLKMDLYRLRRMLSFKVCMIIVFFLNITEGPLEKLVFSIGKMVAKDDPEALAQLGEFPLEFRLGNIISAPLGRVDMVFFLLCVVWFSYADLHHGYIKNIAGQLPSRGHTVLSKFMAIQINCVIFMAIAVVGQIVGQLMVGKKMLIEASYTNDSETVIYSMGEAAARCVIFWLLLLSVCSMILLLTTGLGSNIAGSIIAVLAGSGLLSTAYLGISVGINKLFNFEKYFELGDYMPDSVIHGHYDSMIRATVVGAVWIFIMIPLTVYIFNRKDVK